MPPCIVVPAYHLGSTVVCRILQPFNNIISVPLSCAIYSSCLIAKSLLVGWGGQTV